MRCSFGDYLQRRHAREEKVRTWHEARLMHYPLSMAVTWDTSFEQLAGAARDLLNLLCWLAPEPVPRALTAGVKLQGRKQNAVIAKWHSRNLVSPTVARFGFVRPTTPWAADQAGSDL
jgi:hypothetical protein